MGRFEDNLLDELLAAHGPSLAEATPPPARRTAPHRVLVGAAACGTVLAVAAGIALVNPAPAYAVVQNPDGTVSVTITEIGAIEPANATLRELGVRARAVPMTTDCPSLGPDSGGSGAPVESWLPEQGPDGSVILRPGGPEGYTVLLAMSTYPGGEGGLSFTGPVRDPAPTCLLDPRYDPDR